jgi:hypothetical protein
MTIWKWKFFINISLTNYYFNNLDIATQSNYFIDCWTLIFSYLGVFIIAQIRNVPRRQIQCDNYKRLRGAVFVLWCLCRENVNSASTAMRSRLHPNPDTQHRHSQQEWPTLISGCTLRQSTSEGRDEFGSSASLGVASHLRSRQPINVTASVIWRKKTSV